MTLLRPICWIIRHKWTRKDGTYALHGYDRLPYKDSYCARCGITGREWLYE